MIQLHKHMRLCGILLVILAYGGCKTSQPETALHTLSTDELQAKLNSERVPEIRYSIIAELLTRELFPEDSVELAQEVTRNCAAEDFPSEIACAYAALSIAKYDQNKEQSEELAKISMRYIHADSPPRAACFAKFAVARHAWRSQKWEQALTLFDELEEQTRIAPNCGDFRIRAVNGKGAIAMVRGAHLRAQNYFTAALAVETAASLDEPRVFPAVNLGLLQWRHGDYRRAVDSLRNAAELADRVEKRDWVVETYHAAAACSLELGDLDQAKKFITKASNHCVQVATNRRQKVRRLTNVINAHLSPDTPEDLLHRTKKLVDDETLGTGAHLLAVVDLAKLHNALGQYDEALLALEPVFKTEPQRDPIHLVNALREQAKSMDLKGDTEGFIATMRRLQTEMQNRYVDQLEREYEFADFESRIEKQRFAARSRLFNNRDNWLRGLLVSVATLTICLGCIGYVVLQRTKDRQKSAESKGKKSEKERLLLASEVEKLESSLQQKRRLEALGELTGGVAHDFNNLLTVIVNSNEMLNLKLQNDQAHQECLALIEQSQNASDLAAQITQQLLAFGRKQQLRPEVTDLRELFESTEGLIAKSISPLNCLQIRLPKGRERLWVKIDRAQMTTALINLCSNARHAVEGVDAAEILIDVRQHSTDEGSEDLPPGDYIVISTRDNGVGMDDKQLARACEPFFSTKPPSSGTGLGLSTVHGFVKQSGGDLRITSSPGIGTTVNILLPVASERPSPPRKSNSTIHQNSVQRVLVVDDDEQIRRSTETMLGMLGVEAKSARSSEEARHLLDSELPFDLLLTDVRMQTPQDGVSLARWTEETKPETRIVLMSGYYESVGTDHLPLLKKPFTQNELIEMLQIPRETEPEDASV
ncbi:MAG: ATP-binding protein [Aureliella sp.]